MLGAAGIDPAMHVARLLTWRQSPPRTQVAMLRTDTHPAALREQLRLLRAAEPHERIAAACSLTQETRFLSMRGLANSMPLATDAERRTAWARLLYGDRVVASLGIGREAQ